MYSEKHYGAGNTTQQLRVFVILPEDLSSGPSTHAWQFRLIIIPDLMLSSGLHSYVACTQNTHRNINKNTVHPEIMISGYTCEILGTH